jgi:hypothetical protein
MGHGHEGVDIAATSGPGGLEDAVAPLRAGVAMGWRSRKMSRKLWISETEVLKKAFRDVYATREKEWAITEDWLARVMDRIRRVGPLKPAGNFWPAFEHLVWRLAPASCLLVLVLGAFLMNMDFDLAYDYLDTVRSEVEDRALLELFALAS